MKTALVAVKGWDPDAWAKRIAELLPDHRVLQTGRNGEYGGQAPLSEVSYLLAWKPPAVLLPRLTGLEAIFSLGAGVDHIVGLGALPDVPIARIVDPDMTSRMCEYVVWQVMQHHRQGPGYARLQAAHCWKELGHPVAGDITVGMMGTGVLGQSAAALLRPIGFRTIGWSRTPKSIPGMECFHGETGLTTFLGQTDILVALLPLTPETRGILNADLISRLKQDGPLGGPVLINAGRGGSQVDADIADALENGVLAGASLDVFQSEPLPDDSPLWDAPNLIITPHVAAVSSPHTLSIQIADQIRAFERGEPLINLVDVSRGY